MNGLPEAEVSELGEIRGPAVDEGVEIVVSVRDNE